MFRWLSRSSSNSQRARLEVPATEVVYAIGDIHGRLDKLIELESLIARDCEHHGLPALTVTLGDYVDRGPHSAGVLDHLLWSPPASGSRICLAGNHEAMMLDFLNDPHQDHLWLENGGAETLRSYDLNSRTLFQAGKRQVVELLTSAIPAEHVEFLRTLPVCLSMSNYVFVHAGLMPHLAVADQLEHDMLWMRMPAGPYPLGRFGMVIHGHTPATSVVVEPGRVCLDTSAYSTGKLSAIRISGLDKFSFLHTTTN